MSLPESSMPRDPAAGLRACAALLLGGAMVSAAAPWPGGVRVACALALAVGGVVLLARTLHGPARHVVAARQVAASQVAAQQVAARQLDDAARERFLVNVVHELRTPLALIDGPLQRLARWPGLDPQARDFVRVARGNTLRLLNVADDLLDLARAEHVAAAGDPVAPAPAPPWLLDDWLHGLLGAVEHHPALGPMPLVECLAAPGATLVADPERVERVALNLVANAIKFSAGRGAIRIGSFAAPTRAGFWVEDDGIGIAPEHHARVFERFRQLDPAATRRFGGVGIGLALAQAGVRAMGGEITVRSAPDQGARFTVSLPRGGPAPDRFLPAARLRDDEAPGTPARFERVLRRPLLVETAPPPGPPGPAARDDGTPGAASGAPPEATADTTPATTPDATAATPPDATAAMTSATTSAMTSAATSATKSATTPATPPAATAHAGPNPTAVEDPAPRLVVVVVEDEPQLRWLLVDALRAAFDVHAAADGDAGLALVRATLPDVLLTDWTMPGRDGLALARAVRADPATADVRIAMLTAKLAEDERVAALSAGIDDFLGKPFSLAELAARLRNLGGRARAERALRAANTALAAGNLALAQTRALLIQDEKLKSIGVLAAGLIHEINNPVSYMRTATELLRRRPGIGADAGAAELVGSIEQGLQRVGTLIGDLRVFAYRGAPDDAHQAAQRIDLRAVVASALRLTAAPLRGIAVHQELVESFVAGAPSQLVQVVVNLLTNAADALRAGGTAAPRIGIELRRPAPGQVELRVQDNGPGIAPAVAARLFEPFFTTREVGKGLGLGLAVSQAIVRAHEGRLQVDNRSGLAQGACFVISLPAA